MTSYIPEEDRDYFDGTDLENALKHDIEVLFLDYRRILSSHYENPPKPGLEILGEYERYFANKGIYDIRLNGLNLVEILCKICFSPFSTAGMIDKYLVDETQRKGWENVLRSNFIRKLRPSLHNSELPNEYWVKFVHSLIKEYIKETEPF